VIRRIGSWSKREAGNISESRESGPERTRRLRQMREILSEKPRRRAAAMERPLGYLQCRVSQGDRCDDHSVALSGSWHWLNRIFGLARTSSISRMAYLYMARRICRFQCSLVGRQATGGSS